MDEGRHPWSVPDERVGRPDIDGSRAFDTDGDGRADTVVTGDGFDLVLLTDIDGDSYADRMLRIGPDGVAREVGFRATDDDQLLDMEPE
jgi:hypothetical protein